MADNDNENSNVIKQAQATRHFGVIIGFVPFMFITVMYIVNTIREFLKLRVERPITASLADVDFWYITIILLIFSIIYTINLVQIFINKNQFLCVCEERIYGSSIRSFTPKLFDIKYDMITNARLLQRGDFRFNYGFLIEPNIIIECGPHTYRLDIENSREMVDLIQKMRKK